MAFKLPVVINPDKCLLEDFEIVAFEREEDSELYSYWHDQFKDPLRSAPAAQAPETTTTKITLSTTTTITTPSRSSAKPERLPASAVDHRAKPAPPPTQSPPKVNKGTTAADTALPNNYVVGFGPQPLANGLAIINSMHCNTMPNGKVLAKYKLTKFYNKLRGRQMRRNLVLERAKNKKLEDVLGKSQLNTWLAYTSLQALHLPGDNVNQLSTIAINHNPRLITIPQPRMNKANPVTASSPSSGSKKKKKKATAASQSPTTNNTEPMHFVYIDPKDIVTYSNRICPQQIIEYRKRSHLLPSSATSKRSSAASYDVFEIMDVLANSNKNNVTITRNANKPAPAGCSIYSHSTNLNTRGIVSTQLHLQARSYLDTVGKFYAEERVRLAEEEERMRNEPSIDEQISKYIKIEHPYSLSANQPNLDASRPAANSHDQIDSNNFNYEEDVIERMEEEILSMIRPHDSKRTEPVMPREESEVH